MTTAGNGNLARLEATRAKADLALANFEANKVSFVKKAVRNIVTNVHALFRENPNTTAAPSQEYIDRCCADTMESRACRTPFMIGTKMKTKKSWTCF